MIFSVPSVSSVAQEMSLVAGRLAALAGAPEAGTLLREAAAGSAALYGPLHPWTLLREAAAAIAIDDREALRVTVTVPVWR